MERVVGIEPNLCLLGRQLHSPECETRKLKPPRINKADRAPGGHLGDKVEGGSRFAVRGEGEMEKPPGLLRTVRLRIAPSCIYAVLLPDVVAFVNPK